MKILDIKIIEQRILSQRNNIISGDKDLEKLINELENMVSNLSQEPSCDAYLSDLYKVIEAMIPNIKIRTRSQDVIDYLKNYIFLYLY